MTLQKNDFIEIEFTGKIKEGEVFDSNIKEDLEKLHEGHDHPLETKPLVFPLGQKMFLEWVDNFLIGKDIGSYEIELSPEKAFGKRNPGLIQIIPMKVFIQHKINPIPGAVLNFDNRVGKVLTVSGGRVIIDFNNPLAGKDILYKIRILRKIEDINDKINAINEFLFRKRFDFEIKDKKLIINVDKGFKQFMEMFKGKYKEIFDLDLEVKEI